MTTKKTRRPCLGVDRRGVTKGRDQVARRPRDLVAFHEHRVALVDVDAAAIGHMQPHLCDQIVADHVPEAHVGLGSRRKVECVWDDAIVNVRPIDVDASERGLPTK